MKLRFLRWRWTLSLLHDMMGSLSQAVVLELKTRGRARNPRVASAADKHISASLPASSAVTTPKEPCGQDSDKEISLFVYPWLSHVLSLFFTVSAITSHHHPTSTRFDSDRCEVLHILIQMSRYSMPLHRGMEPNMKHDTRQPHGLRCLCGSFPPGAGIYDLCEQYQRAPK